MPKGIRKPPLYDKKLLLELYSYDPKTGVLTTKTTTGKNKRWQAGRIVGSKQANGYLVISLNGKQILAHRAIWVMVYGVYPNCDIDHISGDKADNCLSNLRLATRGENNINSLPQKNNTSGYKGAYYDKRRDCWYGEIWVDNKKRFLGRFSSAQEAGLAYIEAAKKFFGEEFLRKSA